MAKRKAYGKIIEKKVNLPDLVGDYLSMKKAQGVTEFTIEIQTGILRRFFTAITDRDKDVRGWRRSIQEYLSDKKSAYYNKQLDALRQFFAYCVEEGAIDDNPCNGLGYKKAVSRIVEYDQEFIKKLLSLPDKTTFSGLRDYVFILLVLDTGIRPYEALQLKVSDIHIQQKLINIREEVAKTRQARVLPISSIMAQEIRKLIQVRHPDWETDGFVLCNHFGDRMDTHSIQGRFREYSEKLGSKITTYALRHCFAIYFIRNGGDPFTLQRLMGHTRLDQTREYVNLVKADIANGHAKASPLNSLLSPEQRRMRHIKN